MYGPSAGVADSLKPPNDPKTKTTSSVFINLFIWHLKPQGGERGYTWRPTLGKMYTTKVSINTCVFPGVCAGVWSSSPSSSLLLVLRLLKQTIKVRRQTWSNSSYLKCTPLALVM